MTDYRDPLNYDANGGPINQLMGRLAIGAAQRAHVEGAKFVMHPMQADMIAELSVTVGVPFASREAIENATADRGLSFCGRPVEEDDRMPGNVIELRDRKGETIARIKNLAVPNASK